MTSPQSAQQCVAFIGASPIKNIIPGALTLDWGAGTDFRDPPRFETAGMPFGYDGGLAEEPRRSFSNPDANRLRLRLLRLQIGSFPGAF
jgi:hypothetical protein